MNKSEFSERLYKMRTDKGLSQKELGDLLGVSNKAISKWENGEAMPKTETMLKLAEIMNIDGNELLGISSANTADESYEKEIDRLKTENLALKNKIDNQSKRKKRNLITACIVFAAFIVILAAVFAASRVKADKKPDIPKAGQKNTVIIFNNSEFVPCSERENALLDCNSVLSSSDENKNAAFVSSDKTKTAVSVDCSTSYKIIRLRARQGNYYYIESGLSVSVSNENISFIYISGGSIANNGYNLNTGYINQYYKGNADSDKMIKAFCDYYNGLSSPVDKKVTELYLGNNGKTVKVGFADGFLPEIKIGEFFEGNNRLYFYNYADGSAYEAGEELNDFVNG